MTVFDDILFWLAISNLAVSLVVSLLLTNGQRQIPKLAKYKPPQGIPCPSVSIIVAARNEERNIEQAIRSLLKIDYESLELIVVNDRSTDSTGEILRLVADEDPKLNVVLIEDLPAGWLGKNHAMQFGAARARGEYLLFTDADVVMQPDTLKRSMAYSIEHDVDHLAMMPQVEVPGIMLNSFVVLFAIYFSTYFRPWKSRDPKSQAYVGVGAFNLVRAKVFEELGGFEPIAMRPDDDVKFGKLVKSNGFCQHFVDGLDIVRVPWYESIGELIVGMEKNAFSGVEYKVWFVAFATFVMLLFNVAPYAFVCVTDGWTQILYLSVVVNLFLLALSTARSLRVSWVTALFFPIAVLLFIFIQWRATYLTLVNNGIRWRDTHYSLAELKANRL